MFKFNKTCKGEPKLKVELTRCYVIKGQAPRTKQERRIPELQSQFWIRSASQPGLDVHTKQPKESLGDNPTNSMRYHQGVLSARGWSLQNPHSRPPKRVTGSPNTPPPGGAVQSSL